MKKPNIRNKFIEVFEPIMREKGFSRKGEVFHRIVNGKIVQLFSYKIFAGGYEYTTQFLIHPLCLESSYTTFMDATRMSEFFAEIQEWEFSTEDDLAKMPLVLREAEQYLFPLFDSVIDYYTYWEHLNTKGLQIYDGRLYLMSLALGKYDISQQSREAYIKRVVEVERMNREYEERHVKEYKLDQLPDYSTTFLKQKKFQEAKKRKFKIECEEYFRIKDAMKRRDHEYIEAYVREQEQKSIASYVKAYTSIKKYENYLITGVLPFEFIII